MENGLDCKTVVFRIFFNSRYIMRVNACLCIFIIALFFPSCKTKQVSFVKKQEIIYQTGFPVRDPYGIFYNVEDNTEFFYIADMMEFKKLLFFTIDGEKKMEIPLDSVANWRSTEKIIIKNLDTIIFFMAGSNSFNENRIVFMDRNGNRWKRIELNDVIHADKNNQNYCFTVSKNSIMEDDNDILFLSTEILYSSLDTNILNTKKQKLILKEAVYKKHKIPALLKYNIQTGEHQYALSNMWRIICPDTNLYLLEISFAFINNTLFVYSFTGDVLYLLDAKSFKIKKKTTITSPHTDIGRKPCSLDDYAEQWYYETDGHLHGQLSRIMYDKYNHLYYIVIRHSTDNPLLQDETLFSIQVYDKKFNKLSEQVFDGKEYSWDACLVCSQGLLIQHRSERKDYNSTKVKYDLFKIEK
jgi:hypothetical protein